MDFRNISKDPMNEYRRLAELYAAMADKELEALARDTDQLTKIAQEILDRELRRRGMDFPPEDVETAAEKEMTADRAIPTESTELVSICSFENKTEAILAKGLIDSNGIICFLLNDNEGMMNRRILDPIHYHEGAPDEIHLWVKPEDADAATEILQHPVVPGPENEP